MIYRTRTWHVATWVQYGTLRYLSTTRYCSATGYEYISSMRRVPGRVLRVRRRVSVPHAVRLKLLQRSGRVCVYMAQPAGMQSAGRCCFNPKNDGQSTRRAAGSNPGSGMCPEAQRWQRRAACSWRVDGQGLRAHIDVSATRDSSPWPCPTTQS